MHRKHMLKVEDKVRILASGDRIGQIAIIIRVDTNDPYVPYEVRFDDGFEAWLETDQYERVSKKAQL